MIGIRFKILNEYDKFLYKILKDVGSDDNIWKITEQEAFLINNPEVFDAVDLFERNIYSNQEFKKTINQVHYVIFVNIQMYLKDKKLEYKIKDYKSFLKSDCELMLLITDNIFVDVYSKNNKILKEIEQNVKINHFDEFEYINEYKDKRKKFSAYE